VRRPATRGRWRDGAMARIAEEFASPAVAAQARGARAEHDDAAGRATGERNARHAPQQGFPAHPHELLGTAEAARGAGCEQPSCAYWRLLASRRVPDLPGDLRTS